MEESEFNPRKAFEEEQGSTGTSLSEVYEDMYEDKWWSFDPLSPLLVNTKKKVPTILHIGLEIIFFSIIFGGIYLSITEKENSFIQAYAVKISSGACMFFLAKLFSISIKKWRGKFIISAIIGSFICGIIAYFSDDLLREYMIELSVGILILIALDHLFKSLLKVLKKKRTTTT